VTADININLDSDVLNIDPELEVAKISESIRSLLTKMHRRGLVVAISGGVDSAVCAALAVKAVGAKKVYGLLLPEHDSSSSSVTRGKMVVEQL